MLCRLRLSRVKHAAGILSSSLRFRRRNDASRWSSWFSRKWIICAIRNYRYVTRFADRSIASHYRYRTIKDSSVSFSFFFLLSFFFYLACTIISSKRKKSSDDLLSKTYLLYIQRDENCYALLALTTNIVTLPFLLLLIIIIIISTVACYYHVLYTNCNYLQT
jgi:hypothetical protein